MNAHRHRHHVLCSTTNYRVYGVVVSCYCHHANTTSELSTIKSTTNNLASDISSCRRFIRNLRLCIWYVGVELCSQRPKLMLLGVAQLFPLRKPVGALALLLLARTFGSYSAVIPANEHLDFLVLATIDARRVAPILPHFLLCLGAGVLTPEDRHGYFLSSRISL